jgi:alpha-beta hydrolase superfamily lysophospholipase
MSMPAWFDLRQLENITDSKMDDEKGLLASVAGIDQLIQAEVDAGIPENKIILGGFSQGGAITALSALMTKRDLAGYVVLSSWVVLKHKIQSVSIYYMERIWANIVRWSLLRPKKHLCSGVMVVMIMSSRTSVSTSLTPKGYEG